MWHLTKVYWFSAEYGVVMEEDVEETDQLRSQGQTFQGSMSSPQNGSPPRRPKAFGAGILSSYGEMKHFATGAASLQPFDPFAPQVRAVQKLLGSRPCIHMLCHHFTMFKIVMLKWWNKRTAHRVPLKPHTPQPKMSYKDGYQTRYFALESFEDASVRIRALAATVGLPPELRGDASVA
jgi:phenylalanine-4-hydroxylase